MKYLIFSFILILPLNLFCQCTIDGYVFDKDKTPLGFSNIACFINDSIVKGTFSDLEGYFVLDSVPLKVDQLKIYFLTHETKTIAIDLAKKDSIFLEVSLKEKKFKHLYCGPLHPWFLLIYSKQKKYFQSKDIEELKVDQIPKLLSIMSTTSTNNHSELTFKGSRPRSELYVVDGLSTKNTPNLPLSSIKKIEVYNGGMPARYGNTTSAVIVIETKSVFDFFD